MFRQDPDVIMVGEMRDWNTMQTAITAAETGHLVFSTLHTNSAAQSIDRIIDSCPQEQQAQVRSQLSIVLRAIVSMNLIETSDGSGRCAVVEVMINSPKIAKHILNGEIKEIHEEIENSVNYYKMQSMNQCAASRCSSTSGSRTRRPWSSRPTPRTFPSSSASSSPRSRKTSEVA